MLRTATTLLLLLAMPASAGGFKVALGEMAEGEKAQWAPNGARENTECGWSGGATPRRASGKAGVGYETAAGPAEDLSHDITGVFNRADWLTAQTDAKDASRNVQLAYDVNGNVTQKTTAASSRSFRWDARDTLTAVLDNGTPVGRYDYDRNLQRVKRTAGAERVEYVLDDKYVLQEADGSQTSHPATRRYHYAAQPLAVTTGTVTSYLNVDALGSVTDATSTTGAVTTARQYDAWGQYRNNTAPTSTEPKIAFTGHQYDTETGLVYARARYYDPELGRFLSRDSFEGNTNEAPSLHRFAYTRNNPTKYVDVDGRCYDAVGGTGWSWAACAESAKALGGYAVGLGKVALGLGEAATDIVAPGLVDQWREVLNPTTPEQRLAAMVAASKANEQLVLHPLDTASQKIEQLKSDASEIINSGDPYVLGKATGVVTGSAVLVVESSVSLGTTARGALGRYLNYGDDAAAGLRSFGAEVTQLEAGAAAANAARVEAAALTPDLPAAPQFVYRQGSAQPSNLTARPVKDPTGLSTWDTPEAAAKPGEKYQVIDTTKLKGLCATCDLDPPGHVSIAPRPPVTVEEWAATRGKEPTHPLTQELIEAIVEEKKRPK